MKTVVERSKLSNLLKNRHIIIDVTQIRNPFGLTPKTLYNMWSYDMEIHSIIILLTGYSINFISEIFSFS